METFEITYTWTGTITVEAEDEDGAIAQASRELGECSSPMNYFDIEDETMEVTG